MTSPRPIALDAILQACEPVRIHNRRERIIGSVVADSREASGGSLFVAIEGAAADGHAFIAAAVAAGAEAVIVSDARFEQAVEAAGDATVASVAQPRRALSRAAALLYDRPARKLRIAGITGTNGKTTTTFLIDAIARQAGSPSARLGTLGAAFGSHTIDFTNTTPPAPELQAVLARLAESGARTVAMEVSSHALDQLRVEDVDFAVGGFTNLTRDHLDYHPSMEAYAAAKRHLFDLSACAVLNADDPYGARWADELRAGGRVVSYALDARADLRARDVQLSREGTSFDVDGTRFDLRLPGAFNVANALCAIACARELGFDDAISAAALRAFERVPGRMETFTGAGILAIVDYAHTPDALERVLTVARSIGGGRVVAVFGCGGDRDPGKRPHMGEIAGRLAERSIVTTDNPRGEDPSSIAAAIVRGFADPSRAVVELDRRRAIRLAIETAASGDVVVVAGKGHETYQITGDRRLPFDDRDEVRAALDARREVALR